ncbi:DUF5391 family protein [Pseudobacillus badius]|uniref:DUF5391 family protein n=1 Tax=Bacillus badius TaxID=1455 RepID=UPI000596C54B|nr:DUF5391 family protein [Bacillus badius]KZO01084.1 hypothetical protein A4244_13730 [Bacillus badius]OCS89135.1 hypothetical protein A6M11_13750 [Bacillus badius]OVE50899.1 hypothetical protein B1A98_14885 [Bacillus badius]TDW01616.1 hypothetical protein B0G66_11062 [Bacillus badius]
MENKKKTAAATLLSAALFCALIAASSLSPLSEWGRNANQFNSPGMWLAMAIVFILYIVPLSMYMAGFAWMKYVMAVCCALGLLSFLFTLVVAIVAGMVSGTTLQFIGVLGVCSLAMAVNISWFFIALGSKEKRTASVINM